MNNYILLIPLAITFCSLAAAVFLFLHCRRVEKNCNISIVRSIHDQDRVRRELELTRIEKEAIEKVLTARLTEKIESALLKAMEEEPVAASDRHVMRIEITYI